jgi:hypothetical protein
MGIVLDCCIGSSLPISRIFSWETYMWAASFVFLKGKDCHCSSLPTFSAFYKTLLSSHIFNFQEQGPFAKSCCKNQPAGPAHFCSYLEFENHSMLSFAETVPNMLLQETCSRS